MNTQLKTTNTLLFVECEPDAVMAAAILTFANKKEYKIIYTNRHSINYDIPGNLELINKANKIIILCSSINDYSIDFLNNLNKPFTYVGSTTKLKYHIYNENLHITFNSISKLISGYYGIETSYIDDVADYTQLKIKLEKEDLFQCIKYQYLNLFYSKNELFTLFYNTLVAGTKDLILDRDINDFLRNLYQKDYEYALLRLSQAKLITHKEKNFVFLQGGCPCTLILNLALRTLKCHYAINVCLHKKHFTVLSQDNITDVFNEYIKSFIFSARGLYAAGGTFGNGYSMEEFIHGFLQREPLHGFYKDRTDNYNIFNPKEYQWINHAFFGDGKNKLLRKVYRNFNFTIFLDDYCNADCLFCIEQIRTTNSGYIKKNHKIVNCNEYTNRLDEVFSRIRPLNPSISITGGEPLISRHFPSVLKLLKKYHFRKVVITTNGTDILNHVDEIIDANISHVNFSRPHYDIDKVQSIMRFRDNMADFETLKTAIALLEENGVRTRFNCIVSKGAIDSIEEFKNYMNFIRSFGCKHVVFRELMSFHEATALNVEKKEFASTHRVYMNYIWNEIDKDNDFKPQMNVRGHYYYIEIYNYNDITMVSERANLGILESSRQENDAYIYEMVFHPNGNLCGGWTEDEDILDYYEPND